MKLLNWTRRFSRRGFLASGAATIAAVAATSGTVLADAQASPGTGPAELQPDEVRTLLKFTHSAIGLIEPELEKNVSKGWGEMLDLLRAAAEKNLSFIQEKLWDEKSKTLFHRWRDGGRLR